MRPHHPFHPVALGLVALVAIACSSTSSPTAAGDAGAGGGSGSGSGSGGGSGSGSGNGGSGSGSGSGGASSGGDAAAPVVDAKACSDYCALLVSNCTGANQQYTDIDCGLVCNTSSAWDPGTAGDTTGNTLACRVTHAKAAATDQASNCTIAGKSGGGVCGTMCENFCRLAAKNCVGTNQIYTDTASCMSTCGTWDNTKVDCEIYHLNAAGGTEAGSADTHCPHGAATSHACG